MSELIEVPRSYIVDRILPLGEIHLISGASGVGKTSFLAWNLIPPWLRAEPIFGYDSHPLPYVLVSLDRSLGSLKERLAQFKVPGIPAIDRRGSPDFQDIIAAGRQIVPEAQVFFVEGLGTIAPAGMRGDYARVARFLIEGAQLAEKEQITFIATVHTPKTHKGEVYEDPRQRISGSVAWAAMTETIILIEREDPCNPKNRVRLITLLPRNAPEEVFRYVVDKNGILLPEQEEDGVNEGLTIALELVPTTFKASNFLQEAANASVSRTSAYRYLDKMCKSNRLKKVGFGTYEKQPPQ